MAERSGGDRGPAAPAPVPADAGLVALRAEMAELEDRSRFDEDGLEQRAELALAGAREAGVPELERRARLVQADLVRRRGGVAEAGRLAEEIHRWAADHGARGLLARSHFVLAAVFQELGDLSLALEHAVRSVELLADDAPARVRIDHHARLADCLGLNGDLAARDRYDHVLRLAEEGRSNKDIADVLDLSPGTVRNYLSEAAQKLGAANRVEAGRIARSNGWL